MEFFCKISLTANSKNSSYPLLNFTKSSILDVLPGSDNPSGSIPNMRKYMSKVSNENTRLILLIDIEINNTESTQSIKTLLSDPC